MDLLSIDNANVCSSSDAFHFLIKIAFGEGGDVRQTASKHAPPHSANITNQNSSSWGSSRPLIIDVLKSGCVHGQVEVFEEFRVNSN